MDIAGLSKLTADTIVLIVAVLGFMVRYLKESPDATSDGAQIDLRFRH